MSQEMQSRRDAEAKLIAKAQADQAFRQALLNNPKATIETELGAIMPEGLQVKVVEETSNTLYLVLPAVEDQLSETDLDGIAGGALSTYSAAKKKEAYY
ncbi:MAG: NHLP leader peptide family RiPP precursor [Anaerolineae bacterium]|nr:NHLP leader peptide family RiPP precursor [Anaerolineae bacterium]